MQTPDQFVAYLKQHQTHDEATLATTITNIYIIHKETQRLYDKTTGAPLGSVEQNNKIYGYMKNNPKIKLPIQKTTLHELIIKHAQCQQPCAFCTHAINTPGTEGIYPILFYPVNCNTLKYKNTQY